MKVFDRRSFSGLPVMSLLYYNKINFSFVVGVVCVHVYGVKEASPGTVVSILFIRNGHWSILSTQIMP